MGSQGDDIAEAMPSPMFGSASRSCSWLSICSKGTKLPVISTLISCGCPGLPTVTSHFQGQEPLLDQATLYAIVLAHPVQ